MPRWFKIESKTFKLLEKIQNKELISDSDLSKKIWISRDTYYRVIKDKRASAWTIKKLKEFLKSNWYDID